VVGVASEPTGHRWRVLDKLAACRTVGGTRPCGEPAVWRDRAATASASTWPSR